MTWVTSLAQRRKEKKGSLSLSWFTYGRSVS
jgi:hypothetical protein